MAVRLLVDRVQGKVQIQESKQMSTRRISFVCGVVATSCAIYFQSHGHPVEAQCFLWSVFAFAAPVGVALVTESSFLSAWFCISLLTVALLHGLLLWQIWERLPFDNSPVVIVFGFLEAVLFVIICAQIKEWTRG
jgi:hypothetical protein